MLIYRENEAKYFKTKNMMIEKGTWHEFKNNQVRETKPQNYAKTVIYFNLACF